ncbi:uncharacterized protein LOC118765248 [Octopus sinensis]|uniref:Uncharacterized protein LOC118765248 n=1 Tax=Octopus sinensis TaxID=2607531 RepID=A0A7E6F5T3_9MOLL|nr:uncharacterized protein LOC118765248 [Octopus sinensis]
MYIYISVFLYFAMDSCSMCGKPVLLTLLFVCVFGLLKIENLDVNTSFVQKAANYAVSHIICPCAIKNNAYSSLHLTSVVEAQKWHGEEEMVRIVCQVASKKEMKLEYGHECTFYLNIYNETNFTLEKYTCFKYVTSKSKKIPAPSINIKRHEIQSLKPFLNMSLKKYDRRLVKILKAYKKYEIGVIYIVNVEVIELESPRQKPIHCMTVILYEPWRYNRYKLIDDDCHSQVMNFLF